MKNNKKPQTPKVRNKPLNEAMIELRRSNAASPHTNKAKYSRKSKYGSDYR